MAFVTNSYHDDPEQRPVFRRVVARWYRRKFANAALCIVGRGGRPLGLAIAEIIGGVVGICGEYRRSQTRVQRICDDADRVPVGSLRTSVQND
jgi:hypothetical protein